MSTEIKQLRRARRHKRVRAKVFGTAQCPRLSVFRSNKYIYLQLIDDKKGKTLVAVDDQKIKPLSSKKVAAFEAGKLLAETALKKKIKKIIFDRGGYKYHGRVKAVADGARQGGLKF